MPGSGKKIMWSKCAFMRLFKSSMYYRSYEPPKRDEETEMLRKKRAKRARETRRSTQVSTLPLSQISGIVEGVTGVTLQHQYFEDLPPQIKIIALYRKKDGPKFTPCVQSWWSLSRLKYAFIDFLEFLQTVFCSSSIKSYVKFKVGHMEKYIETGSLL